MKKLVIGILAHVDAGKTTLSESMLYLSGNIRKLGRVDHQDTFLDTQELERARGITIFSKQAVLKYKDIEITLVDTPGHIDFSAEMERTLQVLDYGILVINGTDGIQGHTETLWRLLKKYQIPTFIFVNKMDLVEENRNSKILEDIKRRLGEGCVDFSINKESQEFIEHIAMCDDKLLEKYIEHGSIEKDDIIALIEKRKVFPCYFGAALKMEGVEDFLEDLQIYSRSPVYSKEFGGKIYKISRDEKGNRLTFLKITGGSLRVKTPLTNGIEDNKSKKIEGETRIWEEKADQIRIYSGVKYESVEEAFAGTICAVIGLSKTYPGQGLGIEGESDVPILKPVLTYKIILPPESDIPGALEKFRLLEEEDPQLHIEWNEGLKEIHAQLMGEVQIEILRSLIKERFGLEVEFGEGQILYKETISEPVEGIGHFEPLRHYAEVHLLMQPGEPGSGLNFDTDCSEDELDRSWQRLILTHLEEKEHIGVLTGSPITDMRITLVTGRGHLKHTEGGDFRQATYRAVRQGLKKAKSILLEPYYKFRIEVPIESVGRAMSDIQKMQGTFFPLETKGEMSILEGSAPVATMRDYGREILSYTQGRGRLLCTVKGYEPCHNSGEIIETLGYDSEKDMENPTNSIFCSHGAGFSVSWDQVSEYMHVDSGLNLDKKEIIEVKEEKLVKSPSSLASSWENEKELEAIFARTFGPVKRKFPGSSGSFGYESSRTMKKREENIEAARKDYKEKKKERVKEYLLVDGYNIIFAWEELKEVAKVSLDGARTKLMDILCNYQGFKECTLIVVFDAYKVKGNVGSTMDYHNIHVVFTKEAETADMYIEKISHEMGRTHHVTVATSDILEQLIIMGQGAMRLSANDLKEEIERMNEKIRDEYLNKKQNMGHNPFRDVKLK